MSATLWILSCACDSKPASPPATTPAATSTEVQPAAGPGAATKATSRAKAGEATGVSITLTVNGKATTRELSTAIIAARPADGPLAAWSCIPRLGKVTVTDFSIGDDPARQGELFVASVASTSIARVEPGTSLQARFQYRHAGEPTPRTGTGTMVWDASLTSGRAEGKGENGDVLSATWTCATTTDGR